MLTTHYMDEAEMLCDRVAIMDHGKILQLGAAGRAGPRPGRSRCGSRSSPGLLGQDEARAVADGAHGRRRRRVAHRHHHASPAPVLPALAERDALTGLQVRGATLEDVFLQLTGREYRA